MYFYKAVRAIPGFTVALTGLTVASDGVYANAGNKIDSLDTITVVGELQDRSLQDTQTSVSVITGLELEQGSDTDLYDLVNKMPNVNSVFGDKGFAIRGVTQYGVGGGSDDGTNGLINITIDGAALPTIISSIYGPESTFDIAQVEVFRGAQSTQQGRNALTGAVSITTMDPVFYDETKIRARVGQNNHTGLAFAKNLVLVDDSLALRVTAEHEEKKGYINNTTRKDDSYNGETFDNLRAKLKWQASQDLTLVLGHNYAERTAGADLINADDFPGKRNSTSDAEADQGSEHNITHLKGTWYLNDFFWLESVTTYYRHDFDRKEDTDYSELEGNLFLLETNDRSLSQELKLGFDNQNGLKGVAGVYYTRINSHYDQDVTLPISRVIDVETALEELPDAINEIINQLPFNVGPVIDFVASNSLTLNPLQTYDKEITNSAFYSELDIELTDRWTTSFGFRYDEESIDQTASARTTLFAKQIPALTIDYLPETNSDNDTEFSAFLPKAAISYQIDPDKTIGFVVQKAYRAGGVQRNPITLQVNEFDPEYTQNYELTFRSQWLSGVVTLNANLFYTDWKEMQVPVFGESGNQYDFDTVNAGEAELKGFEVDMLARVTPNLDMQLGVGMVKTEFTEFSSRGEDLTGNQFAFAPELSANLGFSYRLSEYTRWEWDIAYQDEHYNDVTNNPDQQLPSRITVDSQLIYDRYDWSVALVAKNLLDEEYETQFFNDNTQRLARAGDPRYFGLVYNLRYD